MVRFYEVLKERVAAAVFERGQEAKVSKLQAEKEKFAALQKREADCEVARSWTNLCKDCCHSLRLRGRHGSSTGSQAATSGNNEVKACRRSNRA